MLLPLGDDNTGRLRFPAVTLGLIVVNALVWFLQLAQGSEAAVQTFIERWSVVPAEYTRGVDLPPAIPVPIWTTVLTSMFMHGGWMHIIGNMLFLWIFGDNVEDTTGRVRFLLFYLLCGLAGAAAHILLNADSTVPTLGASGAISGVLGAYLVLFPKRKVRVLVVRFITTMPAWVVLGLWIVFQFVNHYAAIAHTTETEGGGVAYGAHIGGFVAGAALVWVFRRRHPEVAPEEPRL